VSKNRFGFPVLGVGVGLRHPHYGHILEHRPAVDFFEVLSENYMVQGGNPLRVLDEVASRYPVLLHGVSLSIGSTDPLDRNYLAALKALAERTRALWVSDHLCWTGVAGENLHDLMPLPRTEEALRHVVGRIRQVQDALERPLVLENASTYMAFRCDAMPEAEFLARVAEEADCGILLDVNNVFVGSVNHGWDAEEYIRTVPADRVCQYHLAGHRREGGHIVDTHDDRVVDEVWELYRYAWQRVGARATLLEWDDHIPPFEEMHAEALKARRFQQGARRARPSERRTRAGAAIA
jgi:uncharacterized protein (UPF0276 family)